MRSFASDNNSGVDERIFNALAQANVDHAAAYGADAWTRSADAKITDVFGKGAVALYVFGGTGANVVALSSMLQSHQAVICSDFSHIHVDECGAPETFTGAKLLPLAAPDAKLTPELIAPCLDRLGDEHAAQPRVISITQANEYGLLYMPEEVQAICNFARERDLVVHMDGARLANAAAALQLSLCDASRELGVSVLSLGGTKNGLMFGEAVIFFDPELATTAKYYRKKATQLASKTRFIAAQFERYLDDEVWRFNANHANTMAAELAEQASGVSGVEITRPVETNMVYVQMPQRTAAELQRNYSFYLQSPATNEYRWVTSFDTTLEDVERFVSRLKTLLS